MDSRFHGNDNVAWWGLNVLDSRFHGNDNVAWWGLNGGNPMR